MEQTMVRGPRSGWREDEIDQLWREIQRANASGQPLRSGFEEMGGRLGRKTNSVRNYYYMQLRGQAPSPLKPLPRPRCAACSNPCCAPGRRGNRCARA